MSLWNRAADVWWQWIVASSWQLAVVICIVAVLVALLSGCSPRLRYGLWLLVLLKAFLPPSLASPWSITRLMIDTVDDHLPLSISHPSWVAAAGHPVSLTESTSAVNGFGSLAPASWLMAVWLLGSLTFAVVVLARYRRISRSVSAQPTIDEGPVRVQLESISLRLGLRHVPDLHVASRTSSPFLLGLWKPRIVIPAALLESLDAQEIRDVLTHELLHWRRRDPWIGWLQFIAQMLFWFHPLVWWANNQLRHQRECVCDELAVREGDCDPKQYGETIVRVLTTARGQSSLAGGMIGVFERGSRLQNRVEGIMNYESVARRFGWKSRGAIAVLALVMLPMAPGVSQEAAKKTTRSASFPQIVKTIPAAGATDVDAALNTITVEFDRDMGGGMSWTGGGPMFPLDKSRKAKWTDKRTCVLPVSLAEGKIYRVGINSKSYQNFRSATGRAAKPTVIAFATKGASEELKIQIRVPKIAHIMPATGAKEVASTTSEIRVTFDVPMAAGMSWTGGGKQFPAIPDGKKPAWSADGKTCTLPVKLKPNWDYKMGLNSPSHNNFQSKFGIPLEPVVYQFSTGD